MRFETSFDEGGNWSTACSLSIDEQYLPIPTLPEEVSATIQHRVERDDGLLLEFEPIAGPEMWWVVEEIERLAGFGHLRRRPAGRFFVRFGCHGIEVLVSIDSWRGGIRHVLRLDGCDLSEVGPVDEPNLTAASERLDSEYVSFPKKHRFASRSDVGEFFDIVKGSDWDLLTAPEELLARLLVLGLRLQASELRFETSFDEGGNWSTACSLSIDEQYLPIPTLPEEVSATIQHRVERDDGLLLEFEPIAGPEMWWVVEEIERLAGFGHLRRRPAGRLYIRIVRQVFEVLYGIEVLVSIDSWRGGIRHVLRLDGCDLSEVSPVDED